MKRRMNSAGANGHRLVPARSFDAVILALERDASLVGATRRLPEIATRCV